MFVEGEALDKQKIKPQITANPNEPANWLSLKPLAGMDASHLVKASPPANWHPNLVRLLEEELSRAEAEEVKFQA